jgi:septal ring factor EnvC (AmiA/AmiB activator)
MGKTVRTVEQRIDSAGQTLRKADAELAQIRRDLDATCAKREAMKVQPKQERQVVRLALRRLARFGSWLWSRAKKPPGEIQLKLFRH